MILLGLNSKVIDCLFKNIAKHNLKQNLLLLNFIKSSFKWNVSYNFSIVQITWSTARKVWNTYIRTHYSWCQTSCLNYSGVCIMGSLLMGSFGYWDQFFYGIQGLFGISTVSQQKCVLVNGVIRLLESVCLGPKVIPLSCPHCI